MINCIKKFSVREEQVDARSRNRFVKLIGGKTNGELLFR